MITPIHIIAAVPVKIIFPKHLILFAGNNPCIQLMQMKSIKIYSSYIPTKAKANIEASNSPPVSPTPYNMQHRALHIAAHQGHVTVVGTLLRFGPGGCHSVLKS